MDLIQANSWDPDLMLHNNGLDVGNSSDPDQMLHNNGLDLGI